MTLTSKNNAMFWDVMTRICKHIWEMVWVELELIPVGSGVRRTQGRAGLAQHKRPLRGRSAELLRACIFFFGCTAESVFVDEDDAGVLAHRSMLMVMDGAGW